MSTLERRLTALEAIKPKGNSARAARFGAAVKALFDAVPRCTIQDSYHKHPEPLAALLDRLDTGTATADDRVMLDSLPPCHVTPHDLVRAVVQVQDKF